MASHGSRAASGRWMLTVSEPEDAKAPQRLLKKLGDASDPDARWQSALEIYAEVLFEKARRLEKARLTYNKGIALFRGGEIEKARDEFSKALSLNPELTEAANSLAYTLAVLGEGLEEAEKMIRRVLAKSRANRALYLDTLGLVLHKQGRNEEARQVLGEAAKRCSKGDEKLLAEIYYHLGISSAPGSDSRRQALLRAIEFDPDGQWGRRAAALLEGRR